MKRIFFLMAAMLPALAFAQTIAPAATATNTFTLKGKVGTLNVPAMAYLQYYLGANNNVDSAAITNGNFEFKGTLINPVNANLVIDRKGVGVAKLDETVDGINFYLEPANINVATTDSISKAQITGSKLNDDNNKLKAQLKLINDKAAKLMAEARAATPAQQQAPAFQSTMQARYKALQAEQKNTLKDFIKANPDSYLSLLALTSVSGPSPDPNEIEPLYNGLSASLKESEAGKVLKASIDGLKSTAVGAVAPDFTQADMNGTPVKLSSFRGKYVLIDFWASWCGPCRQENPNVVRNYNKYKAKNFTVIGVSLDKPDGKAAWISAIKNDGLTWTQVSDLKFWNNEAAGLYSVRSIPQNFLIDPNGKIIAKNLRGEDLDAKLIELFGKI